MVERKNSEIYTVVKDGKRGNIRYFVPDIIVWSTIPYCLPCSFDVIVHHVRSTKLNDKTSPFFHFLTSEDEPKQVIL